MIPYYPTMICFYCSIKCTWRRNIISSLLLKPWKLVIGPNT